MIKHLGLKAYGKINLGLDVVRKREDGYHEVRMIMQTVRVYDKIDLVRSEQPGIRLETNLYYLPDNENNLGYRAAKLLMDEFGVTEGVEIKMKKFIPVAAGMAGGSRARQKLSTCSLSSRSARGSSDQNRAESATRARMRRTGATA